MDLKTKLNELEKKINNQEQKKRKQYDNSRGTKTK